MAFLVQDGDGSIDNANSHVTVAEFYAYMTDRLKDYTNLTTYPDLTIKASLIRATDYINTRNLYNGDPVSTTQGTAFPRDYGYDLQGNLIEGIPLPVKLDTYELCGYLLDNANAQLYQNITPAEADIMSVSKRVDVLSKSIEYFGSKGSLDLKVGLAMNIKRCGYLVKRAGMYI